jgi:MoaA/NifB/PqqE/SkfB family radical SAM enzyme
VNEYSVLKAAWHLDRIQAMREGKQVSPISLQLVLSDLCNHDCHFCAYRASNGFSSQNFGVTEADGTHNHNPNRMIPTPKAHELIADAQALGVKAVTFTGGGEPTVHPDHLALFADALDRGFDCSLNTNGALLRRGWEAVLPRFTYIRFSIDGGTAEEYARIRRVTPNTYGVVLQNLQRLVNEVRRQSSACVVGTGYVVTPENYVNVLEGIERIRDTGATYVRLASMQTTEGPSIYGDALQAARDVVRTATLRSTPEFQVVNLFDSALGRRMDGPFCGFQQLVLYVGANLRAYRCCYVAYTDLGDVGDLTNQRLVDWMGSSEKWTAYEHFDARSCAVCPLADKNNVIDYMVRPDPTHINFI